ncbi:MAG: hypothetical protein K2K82_02100 [Muribaculaceae bacterium]|nr:hypothetical protein [Muribaculaceae bacterium]
MISHKISVKNFVYPLFFIEWIYLYFAEISPFTGVLLGISWFGFTLWQVVLSYRQNLLWLLVMWLFMMMYSFEPVRYFLYGDTLSFRVQCESDYTAYQVALICYLFALCLGYFTKLRRLSTKEISTTQIIYSPLYVWIICIAFGVYCMVFGQSGDTILESGGYGQGSKNVSSLYGYGIIPIVVALRYSYSHSRKVIVVLLALCYILKTLLYGGRIDAIMLIIAFYTLYFYKVFNKRTSVILLFCAFLFNQAWEVIRQSINHINVKESLVDTASNLSISSGNSADVYYASERIIYLIKNGILGVQERFLSFMYFMESSVVSYSSLPALANLSSFNMSRYGTGGGGLVPVFIYAWLGIPGVILVSSLLGMGLSRFIRGKCGTFMYFYIVFVIATIPRWYAYYPIQLIKFCVYGAIFAIVMDILRKGRIPVIGLKKRR